VVPVKNRAGHAESNRRVIELVCVDFSSQPLLNKNSTRTLSDLDILDLVTAGII